MEEFPEVPCKRREPLNGLLNTVPLYSLRLVLALRHTDGLLHHLGRRHCADEKRGMPPARPRGCSGYIAADLHRGTSLFAMAALG
jgi:hypothetical protein